MGGNPFLYDIREQRSIVLQTVNIDIATEVLPLPISVGAK